jgi:hypothetical protein
MTDKKFMKLLINPGHLTFETEEKDVTIGRDDSSQWVIPNEKLSRKHCLIGQGPEGLTVTDLGSKNGVSVDGVKIGPNKPVRVNARSIIVLANELYLTPENSELLESPMVSDMGLAPHLRSSRPSRARKSKVVAVKAEDSTEILAARSSPLRTTLTTILFLVLFLLGIVTYLFLN